MGPPAGGAYAVRRPAQQAIQQWIEAPEYPERGGIPAGAQVRQAESLDFSNELLNQGTPKELAQR
ncbi:hypothetical protein [Nocardia africana]